MYVDQAFETRRKSVLNGQNAVNNSNGSKIQGSFLDSSFEKRREQVLSNPTRTIAPVVTPQPKNETIFDKIGNYVSTTLNQSLDSGTRATLKSMGENLQAGIDRVKKPGVGGYLITNDPTVKKYATDLGKSALDTIKGAGKLTPAYFAFRAASGKPVKPFEYAETVLKFGLDLMNTSWKATPIAPMLGAVSNQQKVLRQMAQNKDLTWGDFAKLTAGNAFGPLGNLVAATSITGAEPLKQGITEQPGIGAVLTDNVKVAQAIDIVFMATMIAKPFINKKISDLNLKASEIRQVSSDLNIKPNATAKEVSAAIREQVKKNPDAFSNNPTKEGLELRRKISNASEIMDRAGWLEKNYAQAMEFLKNKFNFTAPSGTPVVQQPKLLTDGTQTIPPEKAVSFVVDNKLENTPTGKEIIKTVAQAKQQGKNIKLTPTEDGNNLDVELVDPGQEVAQGTEISQPSPQAQTSKTKYYGADEFIKSINIDEAKKRATQYKSVDEFIDSYKDELDNIEDVVNKNLPQEEIAPEVQRIREKLSKADFEKIMEKHFPSVKEFYADDGIYSFKDYLEKVDPETISLELDSNQMPRESLIKLLGGDQLSWDIQIEDIIDQYKQGKLSEYIQKEQFRVKTDKITDIPFKGQKKFYQTSEKVDVKKIKDIYKAASQKVNKDNKIVTEQARKDLFMAWYQNENLHELLGITASELNKKIRSFTGSTVDAVVTQRRLNASVPEQFHWTGITNSNYTYKNNFTGKDVEMVVNKIEDNSPNRSFYTTDGETLRMNIMNTLLSVDTRIDYNDLNFKIERLEGALGQYNNESLTITIDRGFENTVAHEIGHYLDYRFARELGIDKSLSSGSIGWDFIQKRYNLSDEHITWAKEFIRFNDNLAQKGEAGHDAKRANYLQTPTEIFARFVSKFVSWTTGKSGNRTYETNYYTDSFNESDYVQFVKLLQKKAEIDSKYDIKPLRGGFATNPFESRVDEIIKAKQKLTEIYNEARKSTQGKVVEDGVVTTEYTNSGKIKSVKGRSANSIDGLRESMAKAESPQDAVKSLNSFVTEYIDGADKRQLADLRAALVKEVTNLTGGTGNYKKDYAMRVTLRNDEFIGDLVRAFEDNIAEMDILIPTTPAKEEAIIPKEQKIVSGKKQEIAPGTPGPVGEGAKKKSRAYTRVVERLQQETLLDTTYNQLNLEDDAKKAIDFIESNPQEALRVALGVDAPPSGQTETAISIALANRAAEEGNFQLQSQLESSRSLRQTRRGQEIVSERGRFNDDSPYHFVQKLLDRRLRQVGKGVIPTTKEEVQSILEKGGTKKRAVEKVDRVAGELKKKLNKEQVKINMAQDIINSLIC